LQEELRRPLRYDPEKVERAVRMILEAIGEDPDRQGLRETPARVARAYAELFWGVGRSPAEEIDKFFESETDEMVIVRDIPFYSMCEHHLLPFVGRAHVAYIPAGGRITGLSKLARAVEVASHKPQVQERLTAEVADAIMGAIRPQGVLVCVEAEHLCMTMRGVRKPGTLAVTSAVRGIFLEDPATRAEAFALLGRRDLA
jgi:GTP cyclohydrolase I